MRTNLVGLYSLALFANFIQYGSSQQDPFGPCTGSENHCAGTSGQTNIILRCSNGKFQPGNCNDNLGEPKFGAVCIESSSTAGDAQCSANPDPSAGGSASTQQPVPSSSPNPAPASTESPPAPVQTSSARSTPVQSPAKSTPATDQNSTATSNSTPTGAASASGLAFTSAGGSIASGTAGAASFTGSSLASGNSSASNQPASSNGGLSTAAKVGIGLGVPLGVIAIAFLVFAAYFIGKRRNKNNDTKISDAHSAESGLPELPAPPPAQRAELPMNQIYEALGADIGNKYFNRGNAHELA